MKRNNSYYDFKPASKNQLIAIIYHLELHHVDSRHIDVEDWNELTIRLNLEYLLSGGEAELSALSVSSVYKNEKSYLSLGLDEGDIEFDVSFDRFIDLISLSDKIKKSV